MNLLEAQHLTAGYGQRSVLDNMSFCCPPTRFLAVLGHNGTGKSTFFKILSQALSYTGSLRLLGQEIQKISNLPQQVAILEQKNNVVFSVKVADLVLAGAFARKAFWEDYSPTDHAEAAQLLAQLDISHLADKDFTQLSGGEQQMVWLAQMMMQKTPVCLLDEPTQHLDLHNRKKVFELMRTWTRHDKTVICITHDIQYLGMMEGFLLNLSALEVGIEPITPQNIAKHTALLEAINPFHLTQ
ncbi:iron complex transport system ATP-binding protein [Flexibacter flexilis DSM 6793]|uniref:Iron complex transport system ATP-binding protein n=1 Tax=Flexibacter flexilis DSM 6793 TaxID=927664 RepID=A0A1I1JZX9_9BACT|nr:ABC transporter ATP-binding protein [Flexibacter flexilis]SFC50930.1 iron complex transport system ATP-binding protein [Flexibacter flexilis DSM 6793]